MRNVFTGFSCALCTLLAISTTVAQAQTTAITAARLRAITPDDVERVERLWDVELSPDGRFVSYTLTRSEASGTRPEGRALNQTQRTEVWLAPTETGKAKRIAGGSEDGTGFWRMVWSPDS